MKKSRLLFLGLPIASLLLASLTPLTAQAQDTITIKLWMHDHPPRVPIDKELIPKFEAANPGIKVDYQVIPNADYDTKLATAFAAGAGPDLFNEWTNFIGNNYAQGLLAPVDFKAAGFDSLDALYNSYDTGKVILSGAEFGGKLYGIPTEVSNFACYANNDLFKAAGLDATKDFPTTWEQMIDVSKKLVKHDSNGALTQRGFDFEWADSILIPLIFEPMVRQLGAQMIDDSQKVAHINTPEVAQVMGYWSDWVNKYQLGGPSYTGSRDAFLQGTQAIECSAGSWFAPQADQAKISYSIHPLPRWAKAKSNNGLALYAFFFQVNQHSNPAVQAAAWKLAGYMTSFPDRYFNEAGLLQPKASFVSSDAFKKNATMQVFFSEAKVSYYMARMAPQQEVNDALARARDRIVVGKEDISTVLKDADAEINKILSGK